MLLPALTAALLCRFAGPSTVTAAEKGKNGQAEVKKRKASVANLKKIGLAVIEFADAHKGWLPPPAICSKEGKPLLSWRVAILPQLGHKELFEQFKLDEPWDSEHNKKLLEKMPEVYADPGGKPKQQHTTFYQAIVGPGAAWEFKPNPKARFNADGLRYPAAFQDGVSNTLFVAETGPAVPWTKPEDVRYDPKKKLPKFGGVYPGGFHALMGDGSARFVRSVVSEATLRAIITRSADDKIGDDF
jgi:hypothetical protein